MKRKLNLQTCYKRAVISCVCILFLIPIGCVHYGDAPTSSSPALPLSMSLPMTRVTQLREQPDALYQEHKQDAVVSLDVLIEAVLRHNLELQADLAYYEGRLQRVPQETSLPDPSAQLKVARSSGGTVEQARFGLDPAAPPKKVGMNSAVAYTLQVVQPLPWPKKLRLKGQIAAQEAVIAFETHNIRLLDIIHGLSRAYYALSFEHASLDLAREEKRYLEQYIETASVGYAVGRHGRQALLKAQTEVVRLESEMLDFPGRIESLRAELRGAVGDVNAANALLGVNYVVPFDRIETPLPEIQPSELLAEAMRLLPEATRLERQIELGQLRQSLAREDYRPDFSVGLEYMNGAASSMSMGASGQRDTVGLMAGLTIPVPNVRRRTQLTEARLVEREARLRKQALEVNTAAALEAAFERMHSLAERLLVYDDSLIPLAFETYETSRAEYEMGVGDYLNMLDALRMMINLRHEQLRLKRDYLFLLADIQRVTGARFLFHATHLEGETLLEEASHEQN